MKQEDVGTVQRLISTELKNFSKVIDNEIGEQFTQLAQAVDGANKNIFKLQAQITALVNMLIERGIIARETYDEKSHNALEALVQLAHSSKAGSTDARESKAHAGPAEASTLSHEENQAGKEKVNA